jgi:hypothetical protein
MTLRDNFNLSDAVALYLTRYPGSTENEFNARYGSESEAIGAKVKQLCARQRRSSLTGIVCLWMKLAIT